MGYVTPDTLGLSAINAKSVATTTGNAIKLHKVGAADFTIRVHLFTGDRIN